jgi:23S rRNA (pseudouridine1915-N3)-methyltransferase
VALDRRAKSLSSPELATWLARLREEWPHSIVFLLGSDLGLDRGLVRECRGRLSFGPMTLPHELARLVLYEQLYRALSITAGIKYHRGPL